MRDIFCFFCGGEETKWERVVSAVKGSKDVWMRRCDEEGILNVYVCVFRQIYDCLEKKSVSQVRL